jgi:hypothetical protein
MAGPELCSTCGVPVLVGRVFEWNDRGMISIPDSPKGRMVFYESAYIDSIFKGIGEIIGLPIEYIAIERKRRDTRRFMEKVFSEYVARLRDIFGGQKVNNISVLKPALKEEVLEIGQMINSQATTIGMVYGYGKIHFSDMWDFWDTFPWRTQIIRNPYSVVFFAADMIGTIEAFEQQDMRVRYEELESDTYLLSVRQGPHPIGLQDRLKKKRYEQKPGDIVFERCPECHTPKRIGQYEWNLQEGTIVDLGTQRRMAVFDPAAMDIVFDDLESELGESITDVIIEAQRRFAKVKMSAEKWQRSGYYFKNSLALRGLGNITSFKADGRKLSLTIENPCMHLAQVGMTKALCELAWEVESSRHEWYRSDDGDLHIEVTI